MKVFTLDAIHNESQSYQQFINLYHEAKNCLFENIEIQLNTKFSANMSAVLGGILAKIPLGNNFRFTCNPLTITELLQKNYFLAHYGYPLIEDTHNTTISYLKLKPSDSRYFHDYVLTNLLGKKDFPHMSPHLQRKIAESIYEMFINAQMHSNTEYIYTCGQFSPATHTIDFTVVDMGIGFKRKIEDRFGKSIRGDNAIRWATQDGHSTKTDISGGLGLAILKDFVIMNKGKIQIVSDDGFFQLSESGEDVKIFTNPFPGTVINMQFRTDDENSYCLNSQIDLTNIF